MKSIVSLFIGLLIVSCIPIQIAPKIKNGDKIKIAKRFKRNLPKRYAFIFKDPKNADEFYHFINTKYGLNSQSVEDNVPFYIEDNEYTLSFYESEKVTQTINFLPFLFDAALQNKGMDPMLEDTYTTRKGHWYISLLVSDTNMNDCLKPSYKSRDKVVNYLRALRMEYLNTNNYLESWLKEQDKKKVITID